MSDATPETGVMMSVRGVSKSYPTPGGRLSVLDNVDLDVRRSEFLLIEGQSGVGKSTLLHIMGLLDRPDSGEVFIDGEELAKASRRRRADLRARRVAFVFQFYHLLPEFTALENVAMPLLIGGQGARQAEAAAAEVLGRVGLAKRLHHKPAELSGGERQRAAIARALVTRPGCVLADEPTGNLDQHTADQVYDLMLELNEQYGISFVVVTHDPRLAERMNRTLRLEEGSLIPLS